MPEPTPILVALLAGFGLGVVFFGGLWLTVRALPKARYPTALMLGSFWGRTALVVVGFVAAIDHRWQNALVCLLGFLTARFWSARWTPDGKAAGGRAR